MIHVEIRPDSITVKGHANSGPKGQDIVCAAVSVLVQTFLFTLQEEFSLAMDAEVREGYIYIPLPIDNEPSAVYTPTKSRAVKSKVKLLTKSLLIGLDGVRNSHPDYLDITST